MELRAHKQENESSISQFDSFCTNPSIQKLKILISLLPGHLQGFIAIYIKYLELTHTRKLFFEYKKVYCEAKTPDISELCKELEPYCNIHELEQLRSMQNMYEQYTNIQEMMGMMEMMKEIFPEGFSGDTSDMDMSEILNMANMFGGMNGST